MAAIILSLLAAALLSTVLLIPAGHLKQALGIPSAVCSAAAMGLYLQMRTVSGGPGTGIALVQLYLPCAVYGLVILGGAVYTVGAIIYGFGKKVKYFHALFHIFVLAGSTLHFVAVYWYVLPLAK